MIFFSTKGRKDNILDVVEMLLFCVFFRDFERVQESMHAAISMNKTKILDAALDDFSEVSF